jgi:hypothetical protein
VITTDGWSVAPNVRDDPFASEGERESMPKCPDCDTETTPRLAIVDPGDLREERDYCLTCERFVDGGTRRASDD